MIFFLIPFLVEASDAFFSSDQISYKEEQLSLEGHVTIQHDLGIVHADEAEVSGLTSTSFTQAILKKNVEFFFKEDRLLAAQLLLDNKNGEIVAKGPTALLGAFENFSLNCDGEAKIEKESNKLTFQSKVLPITFSKGSTQIEAKSAFLTFENGAFSSLVFDGGVDLSNGGIKASAKTLVYDLKDHSLKGIGKVSFNLNGAESGNLLELWKK
ncbi:MAG: hypothetical protein FJZ59_04890 [Chlamydiae bacterium]|jgi:hypothetical protein|nr:hypothetical protein [Chlamydiota bacterium]